MVTKILQGILQRDDIDGDGRVIWAAVDETVRIKSGVGFGVGGGCQQTGEDQGGFVEFHGLHRFWNA